MVASCLTAVLTHLSNTGMVAGHVRPALAQPEPPGQGSAPARRVWNSRSVRLGESLSSSGPPESARDPRPSSMGRLPRGRLGARQWGPDYEAADRDHPGDGRGWPRPSPGWPRTAALRRSPTELDSETERPVRVPSDGAVRLTNRRPRAGRGRCRGAKLRFQSRNALVAEPWGRSLSLSAFSHGYRARSGAVARPPPPSPLPLDT